jgi:phosphoglycolate phosphatase
MLRPLEGGAVIFDLDGTLIDTADDLAAAMNHVLAAEGLPRVPMSRVRGLIGNGAKAMLRRGYAEVGADSPSGEELDRQLAVFIDFYRANIASASAPFPGVVDLIENLLREGAAVAICTNKREDLATALIRELGLHRLFACIIGGDTVGVAKPDPRPVQRCLEFTGANKGVFIGDSDTDILAAANAGIPCLVAEFGYGPLTQRRKALAGFSSYPEAADLIRRVTSASAPEREMR